MGKELTAERILSIGGSAEWRIMSFTWWSEEHEQCKSFADVVKRMVDSGGNKDNGPRARKNLLLSPSSFLRVR
jgi:hypothetical protein